LTAKGVRPIIKLSFIFRVNFCLVSSKESKMTSFKLSQILPCASFFSEGRLLLGFIVLLMQLSLVLWPAAIRLSRRTSERSGVEKLLAELSETHRMPSDPYAHPTKKFRQAA
jgi:hypothetical protein